MVSGPDRRRDRALPREPAPLGLGSPALGLSSAASSVLRAQPQRTGNSEIEAQGRAGGVTPSPGWGTDRGAGPAKGSTMTKVAPPPGVSS